MLVDAKNTVYGTLSYAHSISVGQPERIHRIIRANHHILLAVNQVCYRPAGDGTAEIRMPQQRPITRV